MQISLNMWEQFLLKRGFRNIIKGGQVTGFQFKITIPYYRGLWVSASFQGFAVRVDGIVYPNDKISIKIGDKTYRLADVDQAYDDFWYYGDPATIIVEKPGGLADGLHKVEVGIHYENSYGTKETPPEGYNFLWSGGFGTGRTVTAAPAAVATQTGAAPATAPSGMMGGGEGAPARDPVFVGLTTCSRDLVLVI
jgi:hypothetical protein